MSEAGSVSTKDSSTGTMIKGTDPKTASVRRVGGGASERESGLRESWDGASLIGMSALLRMRELASSLLSAM